MTTRGTTETVGIRVESFHSSASDLFVPVLHASRVLRQKGVPHVREDQATGHADIQVGRFRVDGVQLDQSE